LPWSWLKSLGLGLGLGLEMQGLGLGLGLDKKVLFTRLAVPLTNAKSSKTNAQI